MTHIKKSVDQGYTILTFDHADESANVLGRSIVEELSRHVDELARANDSKGVIIRSAKKDFIVGADIKEFAHFNTAEKAQEGARALQEVFTKLAALPMATVAVIDGQCLGGGLELALACDYRVASDSPRTKLGFPEIQLGLLPGAGGTQRTPRLIGIQGALDLILTGKRLDGKRALKIGLVDACVHANLLMGEAMKFASRAKRKRELIPTKKSLRSDLPMWLLEKNPVGRRIAQQKAREMVEKSSKGFYPAPFKALDAVFQGMDRSLEEGLELEAKLFGQLSQTPVSQCLIHLFHATNAVKKHAAIESGKEHFDNEEVEMVGVIGAGFMGAGIATVCADKGLRVLMSDPNQESMGRALKHINDYFQGLVRKKRLKPFEATRKFFHVSPGLTPRGMHRCEVVIEAVFEDMALKRKILRQIEEKAPDDLIFASNTSALPIQEIAAEAKRPERVVGMHFFSPVEKMPLLEIVEAPKTAAWAVARAAALGQAMGKQVIVVKDGPGFYTTRVLAALMREAAQIFRDGQADIETIDKSLMEFGFPVGPITLIDEVGIDVGIHVLDTMAHSFGDRFPPIAEMKKLQESGRLGRKNNRGFYKYEDGEKRGPDETIMDVLELKAASDQLAPSDIVDRCLLAFINESVRCLEDGVLPSPYEGDVGAVFGLGFPPFRGGPFKYVDQVGAEHVVAKLEQLVASHGKRFEPAETLHDHAIKKKKFFPDEA